MINDYNSSLNLKLIRRCPVCQHGYKQSMIQILDENELGMLTYATCDNCEANLLTRFSSMPHGVVGNAILTDLKPEEVLEYADEIDLTSDDVLEIQQSVNSKDLFKNINKLNIK